MVVRTLNRPLGNSASSSGVPICQLRNPSHFPFLEVNFLWAEKQTIVVKCGERHKRENVLFIINSNVRQEGDSKVLQAWSSGVF